LKKKLKKKRTGRGRRGRHRPWMSAPLQRSTHLPCGRAVDLRCGTATEFLYRTGCTVVAVPVDGIVSVAGAMAGEPGLGRRSGWSLSFRPGAHRRRRDL